MIVRDPYGTRLDKGDVVDVDMGEGKEVRRGRIASIDDRGVRIWWPGNPDEGHYTVSILLASERLKWIDSPDDPDQHPVS